MKILVLGNGFDLAHELPTKYCDFLEFCNKVNEIGDSENIDFLKTITNKNWSSKIGELILEEMGNKKNNLFSYKADMLSLIRDNIWIDYFSQNKGYVKENWIDFESEISNVIKSLDEDMVHKDGTRENLNDDIVELSNDFLGKYYSEYSYSIQCLNSYSDNKDKSIQFIKIRDRLLSDINRLIRALEIYLTKFVQRISIELNSPDIKEITPDKVLTFNYTNTYEKLYGYEKKIDYDYIHGKANIEHTIDTNNMVLGIDEYLIDDRKNMDIEFIEFKKYYQRIHKETGCLYRNWVDEINDEWNHTSPDNRREMTRRISRNYIDYTYNNVHKLFIFGHSLDTTDGDILRKLILNDNIQTTIYYHKKTDYGQKIANLVKIIGQEELFKRTGGITRTIIFKQQRDMVKPS